MAWSQVDFPHPHCWHEVEHALRQPSASEWHAFSQGLLPLHAATQVVSVVLQGAAQLVAVLRQAEGHELTSGAVSLAESRLPSPPPSASLTV